MNNEMLLLIGKFIGEFVTQCFWRAQLSIPYQWNLSVGGVTARQERQAWVGPERGVGAA